MKRTDVVALSDIPTFVLNVAIGIFHLILKNMICFFCFFFKVET